jgi:hypothetical protein
MAPDSFVYVRTIEQGNVVRWYGINADIDDEKRAGQKLQEDERDLRAISKRLKRRRACKGLYTIPVAPWDCISI